MIKIHAMRCGTVGTDETIPDRSKSKNPYAYTGVLRGERHKVWLPVYAYLIERPKGRILVDTGWHTDVRTNQKKHLSWQLNIASKAILPAGEAVSKGDIRYNKKLWEGIHIQPVPMTENAALLHGEAWDVFGDGTVYFVNLAGHSAGMTGVLIQNNDKYVILTGDACYNRHNWEDLKLPGITADAGKAKKSMEWVAKMAASSNCMEILATHDAEVAPHTIEL